MLITIQSRLRHQQTRSSFRWICAQPGTVGDRHTTTHILRPDGRCDHSGFISTPNITKMGALTSVQVSFDQYFPPCNCPNREIL